MLISTAWAQGAGGAGDGGLIQTIIMMALIFGVFYFLMIRPQQKKVKAHREMVSSLRRGDKVITAGGIYGSVTKVNSDSEVTLEIADGVRVRVARHTISEVLSKSEPVANDAGKK